MLTRKILPGSASRLTIVDHEETYGRHILERAISVKLIGKCADLGCWNGDDLAIVGRQNPRAQLLGIDYGG